MVFSLYKDLSVNEIGNHFRGKWLPNTRLYSLASFLFQSFSHNTSLNHYSVQFSSVAQSLPSLCDPMDFSTPDFSVHHQLPELVQTPVHRVGDAIQPTHHLSSPSPPAINQRKISCQFFSNFSKKIEAEEILANSLYEANITLIPRPQTLNKTAN